MCSPNVVSKLPENQITTNSIYLTSSNFVTISHTNYWGQVNSWKYVWKFCKVYFEKMNQAHSLYSMCCSILKEKQHRMLDHETVSDTCKQHWYLGGGGWPQNLCEVLQTQMKERSEWKINEKFHEKDICNSRT